MPPRRFRFSGGGRFRIGDQQIAEAFRSQVPERAADLLEIAMECQACDRLETRSLGRYGLGWCRELRPVVSVRDVAFWSDPEISGLLVGVLDWLTDDFWDPTFVPRASDYKPESQARLFDFSFSGSAAVACHSGGLDSFGGATVDLDADPDLSLILAGTSSARRAKPLQEYLGHEISQMTGRAHPLMVRAELAEVGRRRVDNHQRSRGLLFLSVAAAIALVSGTDEVRMYENGIGAINLPYAESQIGAQMSRSAHPKTLLGMQSLLDAMDVREVRFRAPNLFSTKGQLISKIPPAFTHLVPQTVSCDTWASRRQSPPEGERAIRCGHCSSCILRRVSLCAGGLEAIDQSETYERDVFATISPPEELHLMLDQVARLSVAVDSDDPWQSLVKTFPQLVEARDALESLGESNIESRLVELYSNYIQEWKVAPTPLVKRYLGGL